MADGGESWQSLVAARDALAARDADLAAADAVLAGHLKDAHRLATDAIRGIEALRAEVESAVAARRTDHPAAAREMARFLLSAITTLRALLDEARSTAAAKTVALQDLTDAYRT